MKKFLFVAVAVAVFVSSAPSASAYTLVNGQPVFGFVRGIAPQPGPEQAFIEKVESPIQPLLDVVGNTRIYDLIKAIRPEDVQLFLDIVKRAGIRY